MLQCFFLSFFAESRRPHRAGQVHGGGNLARVRAFLLLFFMFSFILLIRFYFLKNSSSYEIIFFNEMQNKLHFCSYLISFSEKKFLKL